jgi:hypothetical protein
MGAVSVRDQRLPGVVSKVVSSIDVIPKIADCRNCPLLLPALFFFSLTKIYHILRFWLAFAALLTSSTISVDTEK